MHLRCGQDGQHTGLAVPFVSDSTGRLGHTLARGRVLTPFLQPFPPLPRANTSELPAIPQNTTAKQDRHVTAGAGPIWDRPVTAD